MNGGVKFGGYCVIRIVIVDENGDEIMEDGNGEGWEMDFDELFLNFDDLYVVFVELYFYQYERLLKNYYYLLSILRMYQQVDGFYVYSKKSYVVFYDDYELYFGSGKVVGYRLFNKYYR